MPFRRGHNCLYLQFEFATTRRFSQNLGRMQRIARICGVASQRLCSTISDRRCPIDEYSFGEVPHECKILFFQITGVTNEWQGNFYDRLPFRNRFPNCEMFRSNCSQKLESIFHFVMLSMTVLRTMTSLCLLRIVDESLAPAKLGFRVLFFFEADHIVHITVHHEEESP